MTDEIEGRPEAHVRVVRGDASGHVFQLTAQHVVGRGDGAAIRLDDSRVSRVHARFDIGADGLALTDLGSANGTFVNGQRITGTVALVLGDLVRLGGSTLRVEQLDHTRPLAHDAPVLFPPLTWQPHVDPVSEERDVPVVAAEMRVAPPPTAPSQSAAPLELPEPPAAAGPAPSTAMPMPPPPVIESALPPPPMGRPLDATGVMASTPPEQLVPMVPDATRPFPGVPRGPTRDRSRVLALAAAVVLIGLIGGITALLAFRGGNDPALGDARSAGDPGSSASSASTVPATTITATTTLAPPSTTTQGVALPYAAGMCIAAPSRPGEAPAAVACTAPEAVSKVTEIRVGSDLTCPTGSTRTSVENTKDGVKTSYAYCTTRVPERDGQLEVGSCLVGKPTSSGKLDVDERNCADPQANYRVVTATEPGAGCPAAAPTSIEKSTTESARTSPGKWCIALIAGRSP